jgi:hypothetical protein
LAALRLGTVLLEQSGLPHLEVPVARPFQPLLTLFFLMLHLLEQ